MLDLLEVVNLVKSCDNRQGEPLNSFSISANCQMHGLEATFIGNSQDMFQEQIRRNGPHRCDWEQFPCKVIASHARNRSAMATVDFSEVKAMPQSDPVDGNERSASSRWRSYSFPIIAFACFAAGYIAGNSYSLVDVTAGSIKLSTKPVDSVEMTLDKYMSNSKTKTIVESFIVDQIRKSTYNKGLGREIVHLAKDSVHPFSWGFTDDVVLKYSSKVPPAFFEVCKDSPLRNKEIVVAVFDRKGNSTDAADRGSAGSAYLKIETCNPGTVYTSNMQLVNEAQRGGFKTKARELITLPIGGQ